MIEVAIRGRSRCSGCGVKRPGYDTLAPRRWRHLDFGAFKVFLEAACRRVDCPKCGIVVEQVPWASAPKSRFTIPFEDKVAWLAQRCDKTTVGKLMRIDWRAVGDIIARVVDRYRSPVDHSQLQTIGVDELSYRKGQRYLTLVTDLARRRIIWAAEGRSAETLAAFFREIGPDASAQIEHVVIDMSAAYLRAIEDHIPHAEVIYDRFHVQQLLNAAVDTVRRTEWQRLRGTAEATPLKRTRWAVLKRPWNLTPKQDQALAGLVKNNSRLYRAYLMKEAFADIYACRFQPGWARRRIRAWLKWACRSRIASFVKVAKTIRERLEGIVAYFANRYTNGPTEGINTKARLATRQAYGFHSAAATMAMIELRCGGVSIPLPHR